MTKPPPDEQELGQRTARELAMQNKGTPARRLWWLITAYLTKATPN